MSTLYNLDAFCSVYDAPTNLHETCFPELQHCSGKLKIRFILNKSGHLSDGRYVTCATTCRAEVEFVNSALHPELTCGRTDHTHRSIIATNDGMYLKDILDALDDVFSTAGFADLLGDMLASFFTVVVPKPYGRLSTKRMHVQGSSGGSPKKKARGGDDDAPAVLSGLESEDESNEDGTAAGASPSYSPSYSPTKPSYSPTKPASSATGDCTGFLLYGNDSVTRRMGLTARPRLFIPGTADLDNLKRTKKCCWIDGPIARQEGSMLWCVNQAMHTSCNAYNYLCINKTGPVRTISSFRKDKGGPGFHQLLSPHTLSSASAQ